MRMQHGRTMRLCIAVVAFIFLSIISIPHSAWAAYESFLKIEGIDGESLRKGHEDQIDILSWSFGARFPVMPSPTAPKSEAGKTAERDFRFTMKMNRASPILIRAFVTGLPVGPVILFVRSAAAKDKDYLVITLGNVRVSSFQSSGDTKSPDDRPIDVVSLTFDTIEMDYRQIKLNGKISEDSAKSGKCDLKEGRCN
jgi:type VI secretion system secreted protein Hcp